MGLEKKLITIMALIMILMVSLAACSRNVDGEQNGTGLTVVEEDATEDGSIDVETDGNADAEAGDLNVAEEESKASAGGCYGYLYRGEF